MKSERIMNSNDALLARVARYGQDFRQCARSLHPTASVEELREKFCVELPENGLSGEAVIKNLIAAAEPGLVGNTDPSFFAWVMGSSDPVGIAADCLTSVWGQNAAIYQTSPAAAVAEEAVSKWVLDLLDLPRESSVGLVTGATMAAFVGLAAARSEVLRRSGYDFERNGLQGAPMVHVFFSDDIHVTNLTALRHLGFGETNYRRVPSDAAGLMSANALTEAMARVDGPKIVVAQAGHINSGGFEAIGAFSKITRAHDAWIHVDGAFGLWARANGSTRHLTCGIEQADSWSVDGHKWLQIPYDSGFAIIKNTEAHKRAMQTSASYLNEEPEDGRNPTSFSPELSRRARGFAAWAVLSGLGRNGVAALVQKHCDAAKSLSASIEAIRGLTVVNTVELNQIVVGVEDCRNEPALINALAKEMNDTGQAFVKTTEWKGRTLLRLSVIAGPTSREHTDRLADVIRDAWKTVGADRRSSRELGSRSK